MSATGYLSVGSRTVSLLENGVRPELLAAFHPDMLQKRMEPWDDVYDIPVIEFRAPGRQVADRLDLMGINRELVLAMLDHQLAEEHKSLAYGFFPFELPLATDEQLAANREFLASLDASAWVGHVARSSSAPDDKEGNFQVPVPGSWSWLLREVKAWDPWYALRIVLLALPDADVVLDISDPVQTGILTEDHGRVTGTRPETGSSARPGMPLIVLTEGRTDSEFIGGAVRVLYPHLSDLVRFLDYERKPEGGAAALRRMTASFAAAGVANRVVAVFDNDAAAADARRSLDETRLPANIRVLSYPDIDLARNYPTLGPPASGSPGGSADLSDVNGLAGSIELYLGRDVLERDDGTLCPVQWTSYLDGVRGYQGEVTDKQRIHQAFRAKYQQARRSPESAAGQDWDGMRLIIDAISSSFG